MNERSGVADSARRQRRLLLLAIGLFALSATVSLLLHWWDHYIDLQVYRNGPRVWLDGGELYGPMPPIGDIALPFTYPPLAALLFAPLALVPLGVAEIVVLVTSIASLAITLWLVLIRLRPELDRVAVLTAVIAAVALAQMLEPVRQTFGFGQINLVLMAAVALDCLAPRTFWPRGMLIGIAVSVKLIPAGYLLFFLLRRDWKAAGTLVVSAAAAVGVGFLFFPTDSVQYWSETLANTDRIGPPYFAGNQSLKGLAFRLGVSDGAATALWLGLGAIAVALAALWMHRLLAADRPVSALLVNAAALLLVSPVSWSHHWVWAAPALLLLGVAIADGDRSRPLLVGTGALALLFLIGPQWLLPHAKDRELEWAWWQQVIGSSYVWVTFLVLVAGVAVGQAAGVRKAASAAA
ncbi:glycosyltransferase 87 family protein [Nocardia sp. NPDC057227]|uniref:glycosyltransferase 87 family protein n=1 Tax=Nocardia sp. NPDC057227 TaxID=3346056 RepID=UPI00363D87A9